ncbi:uncharacterized protein LOC105736800 [Apis florea]|uniref:uncharacterized protein LOC105736800 n=1 Tax=Apis florea TaxID=7463 RepID=UPI0012FF588E|nr:uncharacterized protein LOC105736800 [Apis florea]
MTYLVASVQITLIDAFKTKILAWTPKSQYASLKHIIIVNELFGLRVFELKRRLRYGWSIIYVECKCGLGLQMIFFSHVNLNNQHQSTGELLETLMDQFSENSRFWRSFNQTDPRCYWLLIYTIKDASSQNEHGKDFKGYELDFSLILCSLYETYFYLISINLSSSNEKLIICLIWIVLYFVKIIFINNYCTKFYYEAEITAHLLRELGICYLDNSIRNEIQQFSLQLLLHPLKFTVGGYVLNNKLSTAIFSNVITYLIVLVQISSSPTLIKLLKKNL